MTAYRVYFFADPRTKKIPVREYLNSLASRERGRFVKLIEHFEDQGALPFPYASHVRGKIWELRIRVAHDRYRILYAIVEEKRIILFHGFTKHTKKTPQREILRAEERLVIYRKSKSSITFRV